MRGVVGATVLGAVMLTANASVAPAVERPGGPQVIALNFRGIAPRDASAPDRLSHTTDLYALATGERVGTATHEFLAAARPGTGIVEHRMTFRLPEGEIVSHDLMSVAPDPLHPGQIHAGIHPDKATILPERGTGAYAGRTGRLRMAGWHGGTYPATETFDDFYVIELDPE